MNTYSVDSINDCYAGVINDILSRGNKVGIDRPEAIDNLTYEVHPAVVQLDTPRRRLVTAYGRPVNVAFALAEVLWILGGRDDVESLEPYNSNISSFSDDGVRFNAAYGYRLRRAFDHDQIDDVLHTLMDDPSSRQGTLVFTHPVDDKGWRREPVEAEGGGVEMAYIKKVTKDRACNLVGHVMIRDDALHWTQMVRSNDAVWGVPYNMMQFSHLQEWMARVLGVNTGRYVFLADSLHVYEKHRAEAEQIRGFNLYEHVGDHDYMRAGGDILALLTKEAEVIRLTGAGGYECPPDVIEQVGAYWHSVLCVMAAHMCYVAKKDHEALELLLDADAIYRSAQIRFYYQNRWYKPEHAELMLEVLDMYGVNTPVYNWMTTRVEG